MALTDLAIRKAKAKDKAYKLFDERGLFLLVNPNGSKWWRIKYRWAKKEKMLSLGTYPEVPLNEARSARDNLRRQIANGIDPSVIRRRTKLTNELKESNTFKVVALEWFEQNRKTWVEDHANRIIRRLEKDIFPWLGTTPVSEITAADFLPQLRRIELRGAIETAHRALNNCSQIMRFATATGRAERDVTRDLVGALRTAPVKHLAAITDPKRFGELIRITHGYEGSFIVQCALKLAPLFFVRPGELRTAKWADIDLENATWSFTSKKRKVPLIVPLSSQAIKILRELHPLTCTSEFVFPNARSYKRPMSNVAINAALRRLGISKEEMCGHGFRASARTMLQEQLNVRPDIIEHQLTHVVRGPLGRAYARTEFLEERREMMQLWANYIESLVNKKLSIVKLRKTA